MQAAVFRIETKVDKAVEYAVKGYEESKRVRELEVRVERIERRGYKRPTVIAAAALACAVAALLVACSIFAR